MRGQAPSGKIAAQLPPTAAGGREDGAGQPARKPRPALTDDRSWSVQDVAYFLNVSESTVRNLERDGELPALPRIGTRIIFDPRIVRAFREGWRPTARARTSERASGSAGMFVALPDPHRERR